MLEKSLGGGGGGFHPLPVEIVLMSEMVAFDSLLEVWVRIFKLMQKTKNFFQTNNLFQPIL